MLSCPKYLPELDIVLRFHVNTYSILDLSWLRRQPCRTLDLQLSIQSQGFEENEAAVKELLQLSINILTLRFCVYLPSRIQALWQQVEVSQRCTLHVQAFVDPEAGHALGFLPRCPDIVINASTSCMLVGLAMLWSGLASRPCKISVHLSQHQTLWVINGCTMPAHIRDQAWQLVVHSAKEVHGLQGVMHRGSVQYLQTPAAQLANWPVP